MIKNVLKTTLILLPLLQNNLYAKCTTKIEALNKMTLLVSYFTKLNNNTATFYNKLENKSKEQPKNIARLNTIIKKELNPSINISTSFMNDMEPTSQMLVAKKYKEVCELYDNIAKKYGIDLTSYAKETIPLKDVVKKKALCSPVEADLVIILLHRSVPANTHLPYIPSQSLKNPDKMCRKIQKIAPKYGTSLEKLLKKAHFYLKKREMYLKH